MSSTRGRGKGSPRQTIRQNVRRELRQAADRAAHEAVVRVHCPTCGRVPSRLFYDIRCGQRRVYGTLLEVIDTAVACEDAATPDERQPISILPRVIARYIEQARAACHPNRRRRHEAA